VKFNHIGIPTAGSFDGEIPLPHLKMTVSDHQGNPFGIQWQRYWDDAPYPDLVKTVPHVAFEVDDLTAALEAGTSSSSRTVPAAACWSPSSRSAGRRSSSCRSTTRPARISSPRPPAVSGAEVWALISRVARNVRLGRRGRPGHMFRR
jgi:hypothetical protein